MANTQPVIVASFTVPGDRVNGLAWGGGSLWLADVSNQVYRLDAAGTVQASFPITVTAYDLAWFEDSLWAHDGNQVYQLDATGQISSTLDVGYWWNGAIEWVDNSLYVTDYNFGTVHKHNRAGAHLLSWDTTFFGHPEGMTYDGAGLWIGDSCEGFENGLHHYTLLGDLLGDIDLAAVGINCNAQSHRALAWDGQYLWYGDKFTVYKLALDTAPTLAELPDQTLAMNSSSNDAIDLWSYASDAEDADSALTFTIANSPLTDAGVSLDSNRYIDINPAQGWSGATAVEIQVRDSMGLTATASFDVVVNAQGYRNHLPFLAKGPTPTPQPPTPTPQAPTPTPQPTGSNWTGTTNRGDPMSFAISSDGKSWHDFVLETHFAAGGCSGTIETTVYGPGPVANNQFSGGGSSFSFTGKLTSSTTAQGTYAYDREYIPSCGYFSQSGTWTASKP